MAKKNGWVEVRDPYTKKLICSYRPKRLLLEYKRGKVTTIVDLRQYDEEENGNAKGRS